MNLSIVQRVIDFTQGTPQVLHVNLVLSRFRKLISPWLSGSCWQQIEFLVDLVMHPGCTHNIVILEESTVPGLHQRVYQIDNWVLAPCFSQGTGSAEQLNYICSHALSWHVDRNVALVLKTRFHSLNHSDGATLHSLVWVPCFVIMSGKQR